MKKAARYGHAKQYTHMRKAGNKQRTILGRVIRDIERKAETGNTTLTAKMTELLTLAKRLRVQQKNGKDKVYAIHAPEVARTAKGKARNPYKFGAKVSIAVTVKDRWVVGARTFKGNPYDEHTLEEAFDQIKAITDRVPKQVYVDGGYRAASGSTNRCEHHRAKAAQQSNEAMGEAAKQRGTHHRVPESRTQNARQLAQRPPGLHYDSGAGRERL